MGAPVRRRPWLVFISPITITRKAKGRMRATAHSGIELELAYDPTVFVTDDEAKKVAEECFLEWFVNNLL